MLAARAHHTPGPHRAPNLPRGPKITPKRFRKALPGSMGQWTVIAKRLGLHNPKSLMNKCKRPGWEWALELVMQERDKIVDLAEQTVQELAAQREELGTAFQASKLILQTKGKDRGWGKEITVSGGTPFQVEHTSLDVTTLPLPVRIALLEAMGKPQETRIRIRPKRNDD
jgi:hypothetical protein